MSIKPTNVSASSTAMSVALKAPAMFLRYWFYITATLFEITIHF